MTSARLTIIYMMLLLGMSCTKDRLLTDPGAAVWSSTDSLHFDTLFTTTGSYTLHFTLHNPNDRRIRLQSVALAGGSNSVFRINVNGEEGPVVSDIEIGAEDSIHVFVNGRLPASQEAMPFVLQDSIAVNWNNNTRWIQLDAWGQNAHFIRNGTISTSTTWNHILPYVVLGPLVVEEWATLTVTKGARIYMHADAILLVDGSMKVQGDSAEKDRVIFTGDRLDAPYRDFPASWPGIYLRSKSRSNSFTYTIINNAYQAIITEGQQDGTVPKLRMEQCIINNAYETGLLAVNSSAELNNCLVSNCGKNVQLVYGGRYVFNHCTIASYSNHYLTHKDPVVLVSNMIKLNNQVYTAPLDARFTNSICWGDRGTVENEIVAIKEGNDPYYLDFRNGIWKIQEQPSHLTATAMGSEDPLFLNTSFLNGPFDFRLQSGSPAINKGLPGVLELDLDGKPRNTGPPDSGAYEKQ